MPLNDLEKHTDKVPAEQVQSRHVAVIAGSFPFRKQIEEFRSKLGLRLNNEVLNENNPTDLGPDKNPMPAFRFLGVNVQRRELDGDGKPITEFANIDLSDYSDFVYLTGKRLEPEDPAFAPVSWPGLVMKKLLQFRMEKTSPEASGGGASGGGGKAPGMGGPGGTPGGGGGGAATPPPVGDPEKDRYPKPEKELKLLGKTLKELEGKSPASVASPPERFRRDSLDPFAEDLGSSKGDSGKNDAGAGDAKTEATELPEYCLVRVLDITVQPGKTYEYRMQVKMGNPNYGRRDVANPSYAQDAVITSDWFQVPTPMSVDPDLYYYAVEQKDLDADEKVHFRPNNSYAYYNKDKAVILQAHKFLAEAPLKGSNPIRVGEWVIAERLKIERGEYVGRSANVEVPFWKYTLEDFTLAYDASTRTKLNDTPKVEVQFGYNSLNANQPEAVLVDFENGSHSYERVAERINDEVKTRKVSDHSATEVLIINPDGRLALIEGAEDAKPDSFRSERLKKVRARILEVFRGVKPKESKSSPFGK